MEKRLHAIKLLAIAHQSLGPDNFGQYWKYDLKSMIVVYISMLSKNEIKHSIDKIERWATALKDNPRKDLLSGPFNLHPI